MDLKVVFLVVSLVTLAFISTDAFIPRCCIKTRSIKAYELLKVDRWEFQSSRGVCNIDALVLYIKGQKKPSCVDPTHEKLLQKVMIWRAARERKNRKY